MIDFLRLVRLGWNNSNVQYYIKLGNKGHADHEIIFRLRLLSMRSACSDEQ